MANLPLSSHNINQMGRPVGPRASREATSSSQNGRWASSRTWKSAHEGSNNLAKNPAIAWRGTQPEPMGQSINTRRQRLPKMASRAATMASKLAKDGPIWPQGRHEKLQDASESAQEASKTVQ